jgi:hypothetical protein
MTYTLSTLDLQNVTALYNTENYAGMYNYIADVIEANNAASQVDQGVITWLRNAAQINSNDGSWISEYVRNYTFNAAAGNETPITEADFQNASNLIAQGVYSLVNNPPAVGDPPASPPAGTIPSAEQIIENEVIDVVQGVLGLQNDDWAGTTMAWLVFDYSAVEQFIDTPQEMFEQIARTIFVFGGTTEIYAVSNAYTAILSQFTASLTLRDPLIIDLDGDDSASMDGSLDVYFATDPNNLDFAQAVTEWMAPEDGFLVHDLNLNGIVDNANEVFSIQLDSAWVGLAALDSNEDGYITSADSAWSELFIWNDANSDAITQDGELFTLSDFDIISITLPAGLSGASTITTAGDAMIIRDVPLHADDRNTRYAGDFDLDLQTLFLPTLRGYAHLPDLHVAMSLDNTGTGNLLGLVQGMAGESLGGMFSDFADLRSDWNAVLYRWAGVENISPSSRGTYMDDARKLEFLEEYFGESFFQARFPEPNPLSLAAVSIMNTYAQLSEDLLARLIYQAGGHALFAGEGRYDLASDSIVFDGAPALDSDALLDLGAAGAANDNLKTPERLTPRCRVAA